MRNICILLTLFSLISAPLVSADEAKPKYGPKGASSATPIASSNEYFRDGRHPSPDFWVLIGYYVPQMNEFSCSAASVAMVLNAARAHMPKTADDKVVLHKDLIEKVSAEHWKERVTEVGFEGKHGTTLDQLGTIIKATFKAYGFPNITVHVIHAENTPTAKKTLVDALKKNELSAKDYIIANFNQQAFTDDADVGHIAPVGAYDASKGRVLILDPDRDYYEPYWVSVDTLLSGMATKDKGANANRGYVVVQVGS